MMAEENPKRKTDAVYAFLSVYLEDHWYIALTTSRFITAMKAAEGIDRNNAFFIDLERSLEQSSILFEP